MRIIQYIIFLFLTFFIGGTINAQQLKENEIVVIKGEKFVLHQVRTSETIYSITKKYKIDKQTLFENNPKIEDELRIGEILKIPYHEDVYVADQPFYQKGDPTSFYIHTIRSRKETPYFIAKEFGVTVEEIYTYNPQIRRFKKGTKVRIPKWDIPTEKANDKIQSEDSQDKEADKDALISYQVKKGETLYSLAQKNKVTQSEILFYNPDAKNLKAGDIIYLPKKYLESSMSKNAEIGISSEQYFEHIIVSGETMWGVTRKYDVSESELKEINPALHSGFPAGLVIKIPVKEETIIDTKPVNDDAFIKHLVEPRETLYGLANKYNLTITDIKSYNPILNKRNLLIGEVVLIPRKPNQQIVEFMEDKVVDSLDFNPEYFKVDVLPVVIPENCNPLNNRLINGNVFDVALFLPLFVEANDTLNTKSLDPELDGDSIFSEIVEELTDTLVEEDEPEDRFFSFYRNTENFIQFYEGVLIAVDSMQRAGMNIRLNVYDTQQNPDSIRNIIYDDEFLETDLIIGPVYENVQKEVAEIASKNRIPMVSPLSSKSDLIGSNPYYYQINPNREYTARETAELVADEYFNSNFIVFKTSDYQGTDEGKVVNLIQEKLYNSGLFGKPTGVNFNIYDFQHEGPFGLRHILSKVKENVIYIPTTVVGELSVAISNINNLADDYSITLIGSSRFQQYESIDIEHFHNLKLEYIAPYWIDYENEVSMNFIKKFKENFYTEPNNFGIQGYDVAFYFLNAIKTYGKEFNDCIKYLQVDLVQGNYQFEKVSPFGGYMNEGVSVISYKRDFNVVQQRIIGQYRFAQK